MKPVVAVPHVSAIDGAALRQSLLSHLQHPSLTSATIVVYQYNDFDLRSGRIGGPFSLVALLERAVGQGADVTLVTRDPRFDGDSDTESALSGWYKGLERLHRVGATVRLHPALHAKVYLLELGSTRTFFAVGSSNLTYQGMGFRWAECNIRGYHSSEYDLVRREAYRVAGDRRTIPFEYWLHEHRRSAAASRQ